MAWTRRKTGLLVLAGVALLLRLVTVALLWTDVSAPLDYEHGRIAANILAGKGFSITFLGVFGPTSQQAPFYPLLLTCVYGLFGVGTPLSLAVVQVLQCAAGTALVLTVVWLCWSLFPKMPIWGWIAGIGAAVYPTHIYMVTHLQVAVWTALMLTTLVAVVVSPRFRGTWRGALIAGSLSGLILLTDPILALALPICAVAFWLGERKQIYPRPVGDRQTVFKQLFARPALMRVTTMAGVAALWIAPWLVRNQMVHGRFVFVKSTFGYALWQGNNPRSFGTDKIPKPSAELLRTSHDGTPAGVNRALWEARHETYYIDDVLLAPGGYEEFQGLSEPERSELLGERAKRFIAENPGKYATLCMNRLRYFFLFDETNPKAAHPLYRTATVMWLLLVAIGLLATFSYWRELWPTYAIFAAVALFHVLTITSVRFRIPIEPLSFVWAAGALALPLQRILSVWRMTRLQIETHEAHVLKGPHWDMPERKKAG